MKLNEIKNVLYKDHENFWKIDDPTVDQWMEYIGIPKYSVDKDGLIDVDGNVEMTAQALTARPQCQFMHPFGDITNDFVVRKYGTEYVKSFWGPEKVGGDFLIYAPYDGTDLKDGPKVVGQDYKIQCAQELTSLEGIPAIIEGDLELGKTAQLKSLKFFPNEVGGYADLASAQIKSLIGVHEMIKSIDGYFELNWEYVEEGGLGLVLIEGITSLMEDNRAIGIGAFEIINKYVGQPDKVFECQQELIEEGYEKFAQL